MSPVQAPQQGGTQAPRAPHSSSTCTPDLCALLVPLLTIDSAQDPLWLTSQATWIFQVSKRNMAQECYFLPKLMNAIFSLQLNCLREVFLGATADRCCWCIKHEVLHSNYKLQRKKAEYWVQDVTFQQIKRTAFNTPVLALWLKDQHVCLSVLK